MGRIGRSYPRYGAAQAPALPGARRLRRPALLSLFGVIGLMLLFWPLA